MIRTVACLMGCLCMFGCDRVFYYPNRTRYASPEEQNLRYEKVRFTARDGSQLAGYFFPAEGTSKGTVLYLHGNAGNITGHFQHVAWLPAAGWNVLTFDYRGYGQSQGRMTRTGSIADANAALDYLLTRNDVDPNRIVAFGQSLGGAIGIVLAAQRKEISGLATDGAFDSYSNVVAWHIRRNPFLFLVAWWFPLGLSHEYDPIDYVRDISPHPLFIMHGTADKVVDPRMAQRLYDAAGQPKQLWLVEGADHYGAIQDLADESHKRLLTFFDQCVESTANMQVVPGKEH